MVRAPTLQLPFASWPAEDRSRWDAAFEQGDRFDETSPGAHLAQSTRLVQRQSYARFLGFLSAKHPDRLTLTPEARIDQPMVAEYVAWRRRSRGDLAIDIDLHHLRGALVLICPQSDWPWLKAVIKRIAAARPRKAGKYHLVTSERLYALGVELMDRAVANADGAECTSKADALLYRDGLVIALLALLPMRRRTLVALRIGRHLVKSGDVWALDIPPADTKCRRAIDYPIFPELSARIDVYLEQFRSRIPGAGKHGGLWASNKGCPMSANAIYATVRNRTKEAFGFGVNPHRFPARRRIPVVAPRSRQCARRQRPSRARVIRYHRATLPHGAIAPGGPRTPGSRRRGAETTVVARLPRPHHCLSFKPAT
jgi:hypothetical protein